MNAFQNNFASLIDEEGSKLCFCVTLPAVAKPCVVAVPRAIVRSTKVQWRDSTSLADAVLCKTFRLSPGCLNLFPSKQGGSLEQSSHPHTGGWCTQCSSVFLSAPQCSSPQHKLKHVIQASTFLSALGSPAWLNGVSRQGLDTLCSLCSPGFIVQNSRLLLY